MVTDTKGGSLFARLEARLDRLRTELIAGLPTRAAELRGALERVREDDSAARVDLARAAHRLAGIAGSHGLEALGQLARELEASTRAGDPPETLAARLQRLLAAMPTEAPSASSSAPVEGVPSGRLSGLVVVAVDDDNSTRRLLELTLVSLGGARAHVVATAEEVEAIVAAGPVDLVIADAVMPETSGLGLLDRLRAAPASPRLAVLSASRPDELGSQATEEIAWLAKPFHPRELVEQIAALLGR